jgi:PhnB protein
MTLEYLGTISITPWLSVTRAARAVEFYKLAFGAREVHRVESPDGDVVSRLSVSGAEFWVADESPDHGNVSPRLPNEASVKMVLTVPDPDVVFAEAVRAGARVVYPPQDGHGWRVGRVIDPFGHHWEIGRPLA